ncbi:MAG TPA: DUF222 domain-containing protein [Propionibacteriaceae bacterium]|nr:DUF222 domain-containing protein [Propionibacteriaceae bacterium]
MEDNPAGRQSVAGSRPAEAHFQYQCQWHSVVSRACQLSTSNHRQRTVWWCDSTRCWPISRQRWIGLACRISPFMAARRLDTARALWFELPDTYARLSTGELSERVAETVVAETRHLDTEWRQVDELLVAAGITTMGFKAAASYARKAAYEADREGYVRRGRTERKHRRVGVRAAPDTMAILTGYLPVEQGIACYAALRQHADSAVASGDGRTRDQIMADMLMERVTGQAAASDLNVELQLMMPLDALINSKNRSAAVIPGYGPLPGDLAWEIMVSSKGAKWWRRLFTGPSGSAGSGPIVGGDPKRPHFDGWLTKLIKLRDQTCRDPFCDAPIRQIDHIRRHSEGGPTSYSNGRGECERGNLVREMRGWRVEVTDCGFDSAPHKIIITTPTGHHYLSRAPDPP